MGRLGQYGMAAGVSECGVGAMFRSIEFNTSKHDVELLRGAIYRLMKSLVI
jgi:hypothetical protein